MARSTVTAGRTDESAPYISAAADFVLLFALSAVLAAATVAVILP